MEKVSKFSIITVLQKSWILIYGIKKSVFLDADTSISVKPPISTLLCPKHGVLLESLYLPVHDVIHFPGDQTRNTHRPCQNSRGYSSASQRRGLGSITGSFIWTFFVKRLTLRKVLIEFVDFLLSIIFCYIFLFIYLFTKSFIHLPVTLYILSE